jgi:hypothetical protein
MEKFDLIKKQKIEDEEKEKQKMEANKKYWEEKKQHERNGRVQEEKKREFAKSVHTMVKNSLVDFAEAAWGKNYFWSRKWKFKFIPQHDRWEVGHGESRTPLHQDFEQEMSVSIMNINPPKFSLSITTNDGFTHYSTQCEVADRKLREGMLSLYLCSKKYSYDPNGNNTYPYNGFQISISQKVYEHHDESWQSG